jgi:hypothetical protein
VVSLDEIDYGEIFASVEFCGEVKDTYRVWWPNSTGGNLHMVAMSHPA